MIADVVSSPIDDFEKDSAAEVTIGFKRCSTSSMAEMRDMFMSGLEAPIPDVDGSQRGSKLLWNDAKKALPTRRGRGGGR